MVTLSEICSYLKELLQADLFKDYGPNGLQVEGKQAVKKGAFAVSASLKVINAAILTGADFLLTHHGLFWNNDPYPIIGVKKEKIKLLLQNEISLISYHLPLDAHPLYGNNWKAALDLGWKELAPFNKIGVKGSFEPRPREQFQAELEAYYGHKATVALGGKEIISSAALVSGGAHRETSLAAQERVDSYITGSFDEPIWHVAFEEQLNFYALGHSATERVGPLALQKHLEEKFDLETCFIEENNPF